jgi:hypothetical protein
MEYIGALSKLLRSGHPCVHPAAGRTLQRHPSRKWCGAWRAVYKGPFGWVLLQLRDALLRAAANVVVAECMAEVLRNRGVLYVGTGAFSGVTGARLLAGPWPWPEARARLGCQTAGELGAPAISSIPEQLPGYEPASARKGYEGERTL